MRILYDNKLLNATITGDASANFGLGNLFVSSLAIPFVAIDRTVEITIVFDTEEEITCLAFAGHNLETFRYRMYDISDTITEDVLVVSLLKTEMIYPTVHSAKKIILNLSAYVDTIAECGSLMIGSFLQMPCPAPYYDEQKELTNERSETVYGHVYGSGGVMLQTYAPNFEHVTEVAFDNVVTMIEQIRNFNPLYVDMTELNHDYKKPLYATLSGSEFINKVDNKGFQRRSFSLAIKEVM